ncbi:predicted protein [Nematostella vectensis]|uniref:1-acylglycerol-3-phosphate O-acyltransferase n=1 Tax=Nematostella vectensis TaxID=45351 RepID=A7SNE7_NEMVE|nr:predicted protein [Nematostella vectensis]|eukprot:XP_001626889.1 predicted protein [Nematostella vectensis]
MFLECSLSALLLGVVGFHILYRISRWFQFYVDYFSYNIAMVLLGCLAVLVALLRPGNVNNFYRTSRLLYWISSKYFRVRVEAKGLENLPENKNCIIVSNHQSSLDMFPILRICPPYTTFIAKRELLFAPFFGVAAWLTGTVFIKRGDSRSARGALDGAVQRITSERVPIVPVVLSNYIPVFNKKNKTFTPGQDFDVPEENGTDEINSDSDYDSWFQEMDRKRQKALHSSNESARRMVKRELKRNPPSRYFVGEKVLVRLPQTKKLVKGKRISLRGTREALVLKADHSEHKYFVQIDNPEAPTIRQSMWIKVDDITSLTKQDESKRQKIVKEEINGKQEQQLQMTNETFADDDIEFEDENNNGSVLDNAITELVSDKELSGDTVNLYTCFLNNYYASTRTVTASTYFYPSLDRSNDAEETPSYRKYMKHKLLSEIDYLVIPIHLMELKHWIFVVLCTLAMTLELYDSAGVSEAHKDVFANLKARFIQKRWNLRKIVAKFTSPPVAMPDESREMRQDMADDILNHPFLAATPDNLKIQDLFLKEVSTKDVLDQQVAAAGCVYRKDVPMDGNCFFYAVNDQLIRLKCPGIPHNVLRQNMVRYLEQNPFTPDGTHLGEFINHRAWDSYLHNMKREGVWADWIVVWATVNMLDRDIAIVSSTGSDVLRIITPSTSNKSTDPGKEGMILLGHNAELHYYSLDIAEKGSHPADPTSSLIKKYGEGKVTVQFCQKCNKEFKSYSGGV